MRRTEVPILYLLGWNCQKVNKNNCYLIYFEVQTYSEVIRVVVQRWQHQMWRHGAVRPLLSHIVVGNGTDHFGKKWVSCKTTFLPPYDKLSLVGIYQWKWNMSTNTLCEKVNSSFIHSSTKLEISERWNIGRRITNTIYSCNALLLSNKGNYWHIQQRGWVSKTLCQVKEALLKRICKM